ncbi:unnamed protein product [Toxocara canis]|uniref:Uncharacterized protein n=1 Tax=Toxocara canis TaxID=6265 RepID=A0A183U6T1_TOXCA|nr:unnamed protein product [Toxocara canis]
MERCVQRAQHNGDSRAYGFLAFFWGAIRLAPSKYVDTWDDLCWRIIVNGAFGSTRRRYIKIRSSKVFFFFLLFRYQGKDTTCWKSFERTALFGLPPNRC